LATQGTYDSRLYDEAFDRAGVRCHVPTPDERARVMDGIYRGVKAGDLAFAQECFLAVAHSLAARHGCRTIVMGCTEVPLALTPGAHTTGLVLDDPSPVMARELAMRAYRVEEDFICSDS